jgi:oligosaccharyltransferase complex subunit alpha (ribophorin I)
MLKSINYIIIINISSLQYYTATLPSKDATIEIKETYSNLLVPFPKQAKQGEKPKLLLNTNQYWQTPYETKKTKTTIKVSTGAKIISYTDDLAPTSYTGNKLSLGPYTDIKPLSYKQFRLHIEEKTPILAAKSRFATVEVTNWGANAFVDQNWDLRNVGPSYHSPPTNTAV